MAGGTSARRRPRRSGGRDGCPPLPVSHLGCDSGTLHCGGRITYSFHFLFSLLFKLKAQVKEQGCEIGERQSRSNMQQSARRVSETETTPKPKQLSVGTAH